MIVYCVFFNDKIKGIDTHDLGGIFTTRQQAEDHIKKKDKLDQKHCEIKPWIVGTDAFTNSQMIIYEPQNKTQV